MTETNQTEETALKPVSNKPPLTSATTSVQRKKALQIHSMKGKRFRDITKGEWRIFHIILLSITLLSTLYFIAIWTLVLIDGADGDINKHSLSRALSKYVDPTKPQKEQSWHYFLVVILHGFGFIFVAFVMSIRAIQIYVIFEEQYLWNIWWSIIHLTIFLVKILGFIFMALLIAYDVKRFPWEHRIFSITGFVFLLVWELAHALITLVQRIIDYYSCPKQFSGKKCRYSLYFLDAIYYGICIIISVVLVLVFLKKNIYWCEWVTVLFMYMYDFGLLYTFHFDTCNFEIELFFHKYFLCGKCHKRKQVILEQQETNRLRIDKERDSLLNTDVDT